jgi:hypothetical protein
MSEGLPEGVTLGEDELKDLDVPGAAVMAAKPKSRTKAAAPAKAVAEPAAVVVAEPPIRPSQMRARAIEATGNKDVDVHRWAKDEGLPVPLRLYRVSAAAAKYAAAYPAIEVEAADESAAVNQFHTKNRVKLEHAHAVACTVVCIEE